MSNYYGLIFIIAGGIFLALPAVALHFFFRLERSEDTTAGRALV